MANTLRFKRGLASGLPTGVAGEPLFTTDTFDLYIGTGAANQRYQKYIASGTTLQYLRGDGSLATFPTNIITGTGVAGQVAYWSGASTQTGNNNLFWDATNNRLGVGTNSPQYKLDVQGTGNTVGIRAASSTAGDILYYATGTVTGSLNALTTAINATGSVIGTLQNNNTASGSAFLDINVTAASTGDPYLSLTTSGATNWSLGIDNSDSDKLKISPSSNPSVGTPSMTLHAGGNVHIGGTSDTGQRLQVTGDTLLKGSGNTSATTALSVQNSTSTNILSVRNDGYVLIGSGNSGTPLATLLDVRGGADSDYMQVARASASSDRHVRLYANGQIIARSQSNTLFAFQFSNNDNSQASGNVGNFSLTNTFNPTSGTATYTSLQVNQTINQTGGANGITRGLYVNPTLTAAADWRSIETSNNTGFAFYGAGTAASVFGGALTVNGAATYWSTLFVNSHITFYTSIRDNRFNDVITQSVNTLALNRTLTIGNATYTNIIFSLQGGGFVTMPATIIGTGASTGETFQVNGTMKVTGASTMNGINSASRYIVTVASSAGISDISYGSLSGGVWVNTPSSTNGYLTVAGNASFKWNSTELNFYISAAEAMRLDANGLGIGMTPSYALDVTGSARVSSAIAIGTTPDTNKPFKILKNINATVGINFENTSTGSSAFSAIQMGTDVTGGTKFTNLVYASSGVVASGVYNPDGTSLINNGGGGLNFLGTPTRFYTGGANGVLRLLHDNEGTTQFTATTPTTNATDGYKQYSADVVAGNAAPHFRTENGGIIKLYQETTGVGNAIFSAGGGTGVLDDSTFDGYTLRQIVKALRNQGILA